MINSCPPSPPLNKTFPSPQYLSETERYTCNFFQFLIYYLPGDKLQLPYKNTGGEEMPWVVPPRLSSPQLLSPHSISPNKLRSFVLSLWDISAFSWSPKQPFLALTPHGINPSRLHWPKPHTLLWIRLHSDPIQQQQWFQAHWKHLVSHFSAS